MRPLHPEIRPGARVIVMPLVRVAAAATAQARLDAWIAHVQRAAEPCLVIDTSLRLCGASAAALLMLQPVTAPLGRTLIPTLFDLVDPEYTLGDPWQLPVIVAAQAGHQGRAIVRCRRGDGTVIHVDVVGVPLRDHGQLIGAAGFLSQVG